MASPVRDNPVAGSAMATGLELNIHNPSQTIQRLTEQVSRIREESERNLSEISLLHARLAVANRDLEATRVSLARVRVLAEEQNRIAVELTQTNQQLTGNTLEAQRIAGEALEQGRRSSNALKGAGVGGGVCGVGAIGVNAYITHVPLPIGIAITLCGMLFGAKIGANR